MNKITNITKIKSFLMKVIQDHEVKADDDIFSLGLVNSMFAMELVLFIKRQA